MDIADTASEYEELHVAHALANRNKVQVQATDDCLECGLQISSERQIATGGTDVCIHCAEVLERKRGRQ